MELFSLKDDDFGDLFMTQKDNSNVLNDGINHEEDMEVFLGNSNVDFQSPCVSLVGGAKVNEGMYLDISDFECEKSDTMDQNQG